MAALLVSIGMLSVFMSMALPAWSHAARREKEAELVFRGEQYARAVGLYQRKFAGAFPPSLELLLEQRFLRKAYTDPMVEDGEFQILYQTSVVGAPGASQPGEAPSSSNRPGEATSSSTQPAASASFGSRTTAGARGGIVGVVSRSEESSILQYNGRDRYDEWQFLYTDIATQPGAPGAVAPGQPVPQPGGGPGGPPGGFGQSPGFGQGGGGRPGGDPGGVRPGSGPPR